MAKDIRISVLPVLLAGLLVACGGDPHESAMEDMIDIQNDVASVFERIESKSDMQAARGELEDLSKRMTEVGERMSKLGEPADPKAAAEMMERMGQKLGEAQERMMNAMQKVMQNPELAEEFSKVMSELNFGR